MLERSGSATATLSALLRAAHQVLDSAPRILDDPISVGLVEGSAESELRASPERVQSPLLRRLRASFVTRSQLTEDALRAACAKGTRQYVLLGVEACLRAAGLATRAHFEPADIGPRFFADRQDLLPLPDFERLVVASTNSGPAGAR